MEGLMSQDDQVSTARSILDKARTEIDAKLQALSTAGAGSFSEVSVQANRNLAAEGDNTACNSGCGAALRERELASTAASAQKVNRAAEGNNTACDSGCGSTLRGRELASTAVSAQRVNRAAEGNNTACDSGCGSL
jgi:hypothetical protein